jgi:hypothetical protein
MDAGATFLLGGFGLAALIAVVMAVYLWRHSRRRRDDTPADCYQRELAAMRRDHAASKKSRLGRASWYGGAAGLAAGGGSWQAGQDGGSCSGGGCSAGSCGGGGGCGGGGS